MMQPPDSATASDVDRAARAINEVRLMKQEFYRCHDFLARRSFRLVELLREAESRGVLLEESLTLVETNFWLEMIDWQSKFLSLVLNFAKEPDRKSLRPLIELYGRDRERMRVEAEVFQRLIRTYWSPRFPPATPVESGIYELRTYNCPDASRQNALKIRFRNHTMRLFEKHGMRNLVYWVPDEPPASQQQLVYLLGHDSQEAAEESVAAFRQDPEWLAVKAASEKPFAGPLTVENGVQSQFLVPTEYSPLK